MSLPIIPSDQTFNCSACGKCCEHIRGMLPQGDAEFIKEFAFGKLPIVQLIPLEKLSFPLWDWEAQRFMKWNEESNANATIEPSKAILDLESNRAIIINYYIDATSCPFLEDNNSGKCRIYDKKRAYICRLFPFNRSPFLKTGDELTKEGMFGTCGSLKTVIPHIPENFEKMIFHLHQAFPDGAFENAVQFDYINEWVNKTIIELMKQKKLRPAMNYPYQFFLKRYNNSEKIHLTDYLLEIGHIESKEELIQKFDSNHHAKEMIAPYIRLC